MDVSPSQRRNMIDINYRGTLAVSEAFIPLLKPNARIVNVASVSGSLRYYDKRLQARFRDTKNTVEDIEQLAQEYEEAASKGEVVQNGWPQKPYFVSKALQIAVTILHAREHPGIFVNACCPGWVQTDLGNQAGVPPKTPEEGARIPLRLGFGDIGSVSGRWWTNATVADTGHGTVQQW